jgi:hypothetical protein
VKARWSPSRANETSGIGVGFGRAQPAEMEEQRLEIGSHGGPSRASGDEDPFFVVFCRQATATARDFQKFAARPERKKSGHAVRPVCLEKSKDSTGSQATTVMVRSADGSGHAWMFAIS